MLYILFFWTAKSAAPPSPSDGETPTRVTRYSLPLKQRERKHGPEKKEKRGKKRPVGQTTDLLSFSFVVAVAGYLCASAVGMAPHLGTQGDKALSLGFLSDLFSCFLAAAA
jgi:hypothetical protein